METHYWQIADGRIWSSEGFFVSELPSSQQITILYNDGEEADEQYLHDTVLFYGLPLGELATQFEQIQLIQAQYEPELDILRQSYQAALITDDTTSATEIQSEYQAMLDQMQADIEAVPSA